MAELIKNLLELTNLRLGSGMIIKKTSTDFSRQAEMVIQEFEFSYPNATFHLQTPGPVQGEWDLVRINQLMINMIGDALRYGTQGGPIKVKVSGDVGNVTFSVHNNGKPFPKEIQEKIFQGFFHDNKEASDESYGLGLYIVKEVVDRYKGKISLDSTKDDGTTFTVILPRN